MYVDISARIKPEFEVLPKRWIVERTFGLANHSRRLSNDYEISTEHEENMFMIAHLNTLIERYGIQVLSRFRAVFLAISEDNRMRHKSYFELRSCKQFYLSVYVI